MTGLINDEIEHGSRWNKEPSPVPPASDDYIVADGFACNGIGGFYISQIRAFERPFDNDFVRMAGYCGAKKLFSVRAGTFQLLEQLEFFLNEGVFRPLGKHGVEEDYVR